MASSLLLVLALSASSPAPAASTLPPVVACTAQHLLSFVGPTGVDQPWPVSPDLPEQASRIAVTLSDQGMVADGYSHTLHMDLYARTAYVVQQGGFAGFRTIYGPLPVVACAEASPNNSFKGMPLRGTP